MIKRVISGVLSAVISTVCLASCYSNEKQFMESNVNNSGQIENKSDMNLSSTNSLSNYITDKIKEKDTPQRMSYQCVSDYDYEIGYAELDRDTGDLIIKSSQPYDAKIAIIVKDDDSIEFVLSKEIGVEKGKDT